SNGRWNAAKPRSRPATTAAGAVRARAARTIAAAAARPSTKDNWYPRSVADWIHVNGETATTTAAMIATRRRSRSCHANAYVATTPAAASSARNGSVEPSAPRDVAISAGQTGWYLKTTRSSRKPERKGRKNGSWVAAG